jgi:hypothetical protein
VEAKSIKRSQQGLRTKHIRIDDPDDQIHNFRSKKMAHKSHKKSITAVDGSQTGGLRSTSSGQPPDLEPRIKERAYEMYCARGGDAGQDVADWLRAEKEIRHS